MLRPIQAPVLPQDPILPIFLSVPATPPPRRLWSPGRSDFCSAFALSAINVFFLLKNGGKIGFVGIFFDWMVLCDCSGCVKSKSLDFDWLVWLWWDFVDEGWISVMVAWGHAFGIKDLIELCKLGSDCDFFSLYLV